MIWSQLEQDLLIAGLSGYKDNQLVSSINSSGLLKKVSNVVLKQGMIHALKDYSQLHAIPQNWSDYLLMD